MRCDSDGREPQRPWGALLCYCIVCTRGREADGHHLLVAWEGNIYRVAGVEYENDADVCLCRTMRIRVGDALLRPVAFFGDAKTGQHAFLPVYIQHTTNMTMQCSMISC